jgi:tellurium resistance protein TerZ
MALNLVKGQAINLEKSSGETLKSVNFGLNWGVIEKKGWFGMSSKESVDLDGSCAVFNKNNEILDVIYFGNLKSKDNAVKHSGDDLVGDSNGDDGRDNEIISINLEQLHRDVNQVVFILNSFRGHDFATIPYARIRISDGLGNKTLLAQYDVAQDEKFNGFVSMVMGKIYKDGSNWQFRAIGEPTTDRKLIDTVGTVKSLYL